MKEKTLKDILDYIRNRPILNKWVVGLGKVSTLFVYVYYPLFLGLVYLIKKEEDIRYILVPLISFVILSIIRKILNAPRPYEKYDIIPLYNKTTKGCSFPSRHTFSAFVIAFTISVFNPLLSIPVFIMGVILAISRVLCGVHFLKDVIVGAIFALICGIIGFI